VKVVLLSKVPHTRCIAPPSPPATTVLTPPQQADQRCQVM
jgi:hypothetical protein